MTGYVYAIENQDGLVKLGWSKDPLRRLVKINSDTSSRCKLVGFVRGTREQEAELHRICADECVHGEWYRRGRLVSAFLSMLPPPPAVRSQRRRPWNGKTATDLAALIGVDKSTITKWKYRGIPAKRIVDIERATGIPRAELRPDLFEPVEAAQ